MADTVGQVTLDGKGNISGKEVFTLNGSISINSVSGAYTENSTCIGTWQITPTGTGTTYNFNTVVVNGGKEVLLIETDNNTVTERIPLALVPRLPDHGPAVAARPA